MRESKVTADHLKRDAYLYVRQSSPRQVIEHNESTQRQYALRNRAIAAGWPVERIRVIDCDLGKSASIAPAARDGFQQLVSEVLDSYAAELHSRDPSAKEMWEVFVKRREARVQRHGPRLEQFFEAAIGRAETDHALPLSNGLFDGGKSPAHDDRSCHHGAW